MESGGLRRMMRKVMHTHLPDGICLARAGLPPRLRIHASSVLARTRPQYLLFWQVQQSAGGWYEMQV